MNVLLVGDGPLARDLATLVEASEHTFTTVYLDDDTNTLTSDGEPDALLESHVSAETGIVIEAVISEPTEKWDIITELDRLLPEDTPILTATLNATATEVASWCRYPARVVGFAALPPLGGATIIEFLPALQSDGNSREAARAFWRTVNLEPVEIADCVAGAVPRVLCNLINEAVFALMESVASPKDIDKAMQLGTNYPRGPLVWADLIRLDQVVAILEALGNEYGPDQYRPAPLLRQYARADRRFYEDQ